MRYCALWLGLILIGILVTAETSQAGQGSHNRSPYVCSGGPNVGQACRPDGAECLDHVCGNNLLCSSGPNLNKACTPDTTECPQSKCNTIPYVTGSPVFHAELTIIVDDDVSKWDGSEEEGEIVAVTILLKTRYQGQDHLLAQTYQNLEGASSLNTLLTKLREGPVIADTDKSIGDHIQENDLNNALDEDFINTTHPSNSLLDDLLWQSGDSEIADQIRQIFNVVGARPIIVGVPQILGGVKHSDFETTGLASVARLRATFRFVP
jgi:hypothetical protein